MTAPRRRGRVVQAGACKAPYAGSIPPPPERLSPVGPRPPPRLLLRNLPRSPSRMPAVPMAHRGRLAAAPTPSTSAPASTHVRRPRPGRVLGACPGRGRGRVPPSSGWRGGDGRPPLPSTVDPQAGGDRHRHRPSHDPPRAAAPPVASPSQSDMGPALPERRPAARIGPDGAARRAPSGAPGPPPPGAPPPGPPRGPHAGAASRVRGAAGGGQPSAAAARPCR